MSDLKRAITNYWAIYNFSGDGFLSSEEAQRLFTDLFAQLGQKITPEDCQNLFNYIDVKETKRISQQELFQALTNH